MPPEIKNRKAQHEYSIEKVFEAGLCLEGWEIKAIRAGRVHIQEAYVRMLSGKPTLVGATITPLVQTASHTLAVPDRSRSLLLNAAEIKYLSQRVQRAGYTLVPLNIHFINGRAKLDIGLAKGKQAHDKRAASKESDWQKEQGKLLKQTFR